MSFSESIAVVLNQDLSLGLTCSEVTMPSTGEVLVGVEWAGVCGSDLHVLRSGDWVTSWPAVLGHEVVGIVEDCPGGELHVGERVVLDSRVPCGRCDPCRRAPNLCDSLTWLGESRPGGYQSRLVVPVSATVHVPDELESDLAVLAEPLAVALHALARGTAAAGGSLGDCLVLGGGPIGQLVTSLLLEGMGAPRSITVVEPQAERRRLAEAIGADVAEAIDRTLRWTTVIDAAGYDDSLLDCVRAVGSGGTIVIVSLPHTPVSLTPAVVAEKAVTIVGVNGFDVELPLAVSTLVANPARFRPLISEAVLLEDAPAALSRWLATPPTGKAVIRP
jgi:2-desacetyl-2-hydroxyethyl bacteriochlorophyllide A dehydrogenase